MAERSPQASTTFIEQMGLLMEREGVPRIAGRIFGLLVVSVEPLSLDAMAQELGVSKASISTDARRLEQVGLIERVALPGDRRDYYAVAPDAAVRTVALQLAATRRFQTILDNLRVADLPTATAERLSGYDHTLRTFIAVLSAALAELRNEQRDREEVPFARTGIL